MALSAGTRLGTYEITGELGAGGMGEVYRAKDSNLKREVAIKLLPEAFVEDADRLARFRREAEVLASLNHANIAQIYGLERADGKTLIVMELIDGPTLADRIAEGPIPAGEALNIAMQIANALEAAHERNIVHRDLKPANIKLKADGTVKVLDFGIAKAFDPQSTTSGTQSPVMTTPVTQTGVILGTAAYMSPEQARGKAVDRRTDIWAFGCLLFEMLTGQPAFAGEDVAVTLARIIAHGANTDSLPGTISPAVRHTIELCLEKDPKRRFADISDVRLGLEGRLESDLTPEALGAVRGPASRRMRLVAAAFVGALAAGALVYLWTRPEPPPAPLVSRLLVTPPSTTPLASLGGYDLAISPDGTELAYFVWADAQHTRVALDIRGLDTLEARAVPGTASSSIGAINPFFSADGTWIGYSRGSEGIVRVAVSGGPAIKIVENTPAFLGATTAADGTLIYALADGLYRVSSGGGGTPVRLTPEPEPNQLPYIAPMLLPGGHAVLFCFGNARVAVLDLDTGEQKILIEGGQNAVYAPTGHIVFARENTLMAVPFDVDRLAVTGEPVGVLQGIRNPPGNTAADFALSATGTLAYVQDSGETATAELVWVNRNGDVIGDAVTDPIDGLISPRLSPDGRRVVLAQGPQGSSSLWIYDLDGKPPIPLTVDADSGVAAWSPDGAQIAFNSNRGGGTYTLYTAPADGSILDPQPLRSDGLDLSPLAWLADDELILLRCCGAEDVLAAGLGAEDELRDVVVTENLEYDAAVSPNGRWLAYVSDRTGQPEIWVKRYPDGVPVRVSSAGGVEPRWSHDGRELYYLAGSALMAVSTETEGDFSFEAAVELFDEPFLIRPGPYFDSYDVASDGRFLMIRPSESESPNQGSDSIVVVQNWFEELKRLVPTE